jgi:hypothetical protein
MNCFFPIYCISKGFVFYVAELPWDEPTMKNKEYMDWLANKINRTPWVKIDPLPLG